MKNKVKKDLNVISGEFVKKANKKMKVFSKGLLTTKVDNKLSKEEKGRKEKREKDKNLKSGKVKNK